VIDLIVDSSPARPPREPAVRKKGDKVQKPSGRPSTPAGATRGAEAAWWRDNAGEVEEIGDRAADVSLEKLYDLLIETRAAFTLRDLGQEPIPSWWPTGRDGDHHREIQFKDRFGKVKRDTFAKYISRHDNAELRPASAPALVSQVDRTTESKKSRAFGQAETVLRAIDKANELANQLFCEPEKQDSIRAAIREILARCQWDNDRIDGIVEQDAAGIVAILHRRRDQIETLAKSAGAR
jgi:hypothetical protein